MAGIHFEDLNSPWFDIMNVRYALSSTLKPGPRWRPVAAGVYKNESVLDRVRYVPCAVPAESIEEIMGQIQGGVGRGAVILSKSWVSEPGCRAPKGTTAEVTVQWLGAPGEFEAQLDVPAGGGYLAVADTWYPGWTATVNGEPTEIMMANGSTRALVLPPGPAVVRMTYASEVWTLGAVISVLGLLMLGLLARRRE
jgi:hypothetical protein